MAERIGIYGGSFDPIHVGHLLVAESAREQLRLDQVLFVPAARAPHKVQEPITEGRHRRTMVELAIAGHSAFELCPVELDRSGISFTIDTLRALQAGRPEAEWFLLLGADSLLDLPNWREAEAIVSLVTITVAGRPGWTLPEPEALAPLFSAEQAQQLQEHLLDMPLVDLSSRDIRRRVHEGRSIRYRVLAAVEAYIHAHGLYRKEGL